MATYALVDSTNTCVNIIVSDAVFSGNLKSVIAKAFAAAQQAGKTKPDDMPGFLMDLKTATQIDQLNPQPGIGWTFNQTSGWSAPPSTNPLILPVGVPGAKA